MDSRLGRIELISWQAPARPRRRPGLRVSTIVLMALAAVGAIVAWIAHAGGLHLGKEAEIAALMLVLPWAAERLFAVVRSSVSWVIQ